jgi:hypothetical protein
MSERRDHEWLLARERGEDVSHVPAATRTPYDELGVMLRDLPAMTPRGAWKARVLAVIDEEEAKRLAAGSVQRPVAKVEPKLAANAGYPATDVEDEVAKPRLTAVPTVAPAVEMPAPPKALAAKRHRWLVPTLATAAAAAAAIAVYLAMPRGSSEPSQANNQLGAPPSTNKPPSTSAIAALETELRDGANKVRGIRDGDGVARLRDTFVARVKTTGPAELRLYGDTGELLAQCGERARSAGCTVTRDGEHRRFVLETLLEARGQVRLVTFTGAQIPESLNDRTLDIDAVIKAGVAYKEELPFDVL